MRGPHRRPRVVQNAGDLAWTVVRAGLIALFLVSGVAIVTAARSIEIGPRVGDIVVFRPDAHLAGDWQIIAVRTATDASCMLQPDAMTAGGGSLVIEARSLEPRQYRVHWAGRHTSDSATDCGSTADLTLSRPNLQMLINAVVGVERRTFAGF